MKFQDEEEKKDWLGESPFKPKDLSVEE